ncbi:MAG: DNA-J related domain-containing protein [Thiohalomonadales bacterium]
MRDGYRNPLLKIIRDILLREDNPLSEYELIKRIGSSTIDSDSLSLKAQQQNHKLALFQRHFIVMNALYQLQGQFFSEDYHLNISALEIILQKIAAQSVSGAVSRPVDQRLCDYYLDWNNFIQTTSDDVDTLLCSFWRGYMSSDQRIDALQQLELPVDADWQAIKTQYRRLVALHHPDKGGNTGDFARIRQAYEMLRQHN